jgi:hypothetical protein
MVAGGDTAKGGRRGEVGRGEQQGVPTMDCAARCVKGLDAQLYRQAVLQEAAQERCKRHAH